jgi:hypothetical protein
LTVKLIVSQVTLNSTQNDPTQGGVLGLGMVAQAPMKGVGDVFYLESCHKHDYVMLGA